MSNSFSSVHIHAVFATKDRHPFLKEKAIREEMHSYLAEISKRLDCFPRLVGGPEDHVHILASLGKTISQSDWIKELKRASTIWIKDHEPRLRQFSWQGGYGTFSVSHGDLRSIERYIQNQEEHHRSRSFHDELRELLSEHGLEWQEEYL